MAYDYRKLGQPYTETERAARHAATYGETELPPRGTGLIRANESLEGRRLGTPKIEEQRMLTHYQRYGTMEKMPTRGTGLSVGSNSTGTFLMGALFGAAVGGVLGAIVFSALASSKG